MFKWGRARQQGNGAPDAATRTGDQGDFVLEG